MENKQTKLFGTYSALQVGDRGMQITLPSAYCKLNGIKPGTPLNLYVVDGTDMLILQPKKPTA